MQFASTLLPGSLFQSLLKLHPRKQSLIFHIHQFRFAHRGNHCRISPRSIPPRSRHAIHYLLARPCRRRNYHPSRTHTKRIHPSLIHIGHKTILRSRQVLSSPRTVMILHTIYIKLCMLHPQTDSKLFGFHVYIPGMKHPVYISRRMSRRQDNMLRKKFLPSGNNTPHMPVPYQQISYPGVETNTSPEPLYCFPYINNHPGQFIRTDMRMGICQNSFIRTKMH